MSLGRYAINQGWLNYLLIAMGCKELLSRMAGESEYSLQSNWEAIGYKMLLHF